MAYDNYENTPFDLDHDGHIDSNEAAYIYETFYNEDNNTNEDDSSFDEDCEDDVEEFSSGGGHISYGKTSYTEIHRNKTAENQRDINFSDGKPIKNLSKEVYRDSIRKHSIIMAVIVGGFQMLSGYWGTAIVSIVVILSIGSWITSDK